MQKKVKSIGKINPRQPLTSQNKASRMKPLVMNKDDLAEKQIGKNRTVQVA
jgi:hypothetical protein